MKTSTILPETNVKSCRYVVDHTYSGCFDASMPEGFVDYIIECEFVVPVYDYFSGNSFTGMNFRVRFSPNAEPPTDEYIRSMGDMFTNRHRVTARYFEDDWSISQYFDRGTGCD